MSTLHQPFHRRMMDDGMMHPRSQFLSFFYLCRRSKPAEQQTKGRAFRGGRLIIGYDYSDGGPVSEPEEEGLEEALVNTVVPTVRHPHTNAICGRTRGSVRLGRYDHTRCCVVRAHSPTSSQLSLRDAFRWGVRRGGRSPTSPKRDLSHDTPRTRNTTPLATGHHHGTTGMLRHLDTHPERDRRTILKLFVFFLTRELIL